MRLDRTNRGIDVEPGSIPEMHVWMDEMEEEKISDQIHLFNFKDLYREKLVNRSDSLFSIPRGFLDKLIFIALHVCHVCLPRLLAPKIAVRRVSDMLGHVHLL